MERILLIENEPDLVDLLELRLGEAGYHVVSVNSGHSGVAAISENLPDLVILDFALRDIPGLEVLDQIRENHQWALLPIIALSAHSDVESRIDGLSRGADDYMGKPFSIQELILRVQSLLRRSALARTFVRSGPLLNDRVNLRCYLRGKPLNLTTIEYKIITCLLDSLGQTIPRSQIIERVWDKSQEDPSRSLDTHMKRLRNKLGAYSRVIRTVRNGGYRFVSPD